MTILPTKLSTGNEKINIVRRLFAGRVVEVDGFILMSKGFVKDGSKDRDYRRDDIND